MKINESRALPGGMLNSHEKTDYETWLDELSKKNDKARAGDTFKTYLYMSKDCGSNGYHDDNGDEIKLEDFPKIFKKIYDETHNF